MISDWIQTSTHTVVFTGAGMSTESGLPDFRSANQGLWQQKDPSLVASVQALNDNVEEFIDFYRKRVLGVKEYEPHAGHQILAEWEKRSRIHSIITQNVDGFHQQAGSHKVAELHGTLQKVHCQACGMSYSSEDFLDGSYHCSCGGILRPSVVLFGEMLPEAPFEMAFAEASRAELFIVLGSSLSVTPANQFPLIAKEHGAKLVIVNQEATPLDGYADLVINNRQIGDVLDEWNRF
ncbi:NAD-dependent protein deacylase [Microbacterium sp. APC 3898]|uniref:NAD-dependent protein deacetylase n=1 Tax=Planococcus notacanthi TaxID=3035188 RepID=A0ABT7ZHF3_9BACL|nr:MULTISPECIES: NAD-dependent protein deacylase [Terrabacteria group]MDN3426591.1 NAD-dependent protein deacylase [Planococcus sp. APC 4016]MDN3500445.1 NAD-dependent protein deacylase [Microbacterium sp. APC 3898]